VNDNLYSVFERHFPADRTKPFILHPDGTAIRYAELEAETARLANAMADMGLVPGDRVTVQVEKSPRAVALYLACMRAGLVFHPLNTAYQRSELEYFLGNAGPKLVVCDPHSLALIQELCADAGIHHVHTLDCDGFGSLSQAAANQPASYPTVERQADDLASLLYSSGTTGRPKGVMLSHGNLSSNATTLAELWGFTAEDRLLHALPIFHVHGLFVAIGCVLMRGASMWFLPKFDPAEIIRLLPSSTVFMGVPTFYTRLLATPAFTPEACRAIRLFVSGSAPLLGETFSEFEARTGHRILERYGMTETGMNTSNPLDGERRAGSVGLPLPGVGVRVVDDDGAPAAPDSVGQIQVKGPNVFKGYWHMPEKTAEEFTADGWFRTGDMGEVAADGYVTIVGRAKDLIISGGLNIYPKEIELCIDAMDGVRESAVFGVAHADFGEAVAAAVVLRDGADVTPDEVIGHVKARMANFKVPKQVHVLPDLPRNTMGKVQKNVLRDTFGH
jgi:malonyl-CoA/methylmalonyl-CoA synthetase